MDMYLKMAWYVFLASQIEQSYQAYQEDFFLPLDLLWLAECSRLGVYL